MVFRDHIPPPFRQVVAVAATVVSSRHTTKDQVGINSRAGEVEVRKCHTDLHPLGMEGTALLLLVVVLVVAMSDTVVEGPCLVLLREVGVAVADVQVTLLIPCPPPSISLLLVDKQDSQCSKLEVWAQL